MVCTSDSGMKLYEIEEYSDHEYITGYHAWNVGVLMKRYIKILMITLGIQLGSLIIAMLLANMFRMQGNLALLGTVLLLISFPISIVVDIVLSIKWGASLAEKLIYIFFMPTNYTLFIFILFAFQVIRQWMEILYNLSPNFG